jgi:hypothetical protein
MKSLIPIVLVLHSTVLLSHGQAPKAPPMRDAATHQQIVVMSRNASQADPMLKQTPAKGPDPSTATPVKSLLAESDVICFNGNVTLVPKRAILQIPKNLEDRFKYKPGAKLLSWAEFFALNRGWITTVEVSRPQAEGNVPIAEETRKTISKSGNLIVATYQAGPISVLPPKAPVAPATPAPQP